MVAIRGGSRPYPENNRRQSIVELLGSRVFVTEAEPNSRRAGREILHEHVRIDEERIENLRPPSGSL